MYNHLLYFAFWVANTFALIFGSLLMPGQIYLGSWRFNLFESAIYTAFWLTFLFWIWWDFSVSRNFKLRKGSTLVYFWLVNSVSLWLVSRFSAFTGFSLSPDGVLVTIFFWGAVMVTAQAFCWKLIIKRGSFLGF